MLKNTFASAGLRKTAETRIDGIADKRALAAAVEPKQKNQPKREKSQDPQELADQEPSQGNKPEQKDGGKDPKPKDGSDPKGPQPDDSPGKQTSSKDAPPAGETGEFESPQTS